MLRKGRVIRFDAVAIESLKKAMREGQPASSSTITAAAYSRPRSARSPDKAFEDALLATAPPSRKRRGR